MLWFGPNVLERIICSLTDDKIFRSTDPCSVFVLVKDSSLRRSGVPGCQNRDESERIMNN